MNVEDFLTAADTSRMQGGGKSMYDKVYDAATAGTAGAVVSGLSSLYNTGIQVANLFGAQMEELKTAEVLGNIDSNWKQYYEENSTVIDTVGFIGGAFIPGMIAVKGLQLARAGASVGTYRNVLNFAVNKQRAALKSGLDEIAQTGGTVFARINTNKLKGMAWGAADNVLQTAVFETAAAATMHASPFFAGDSFGDITWDITKTSLAGGVLGGAVEALFTNKIFKDAGKLVDRTQRKYDTVVSLEKMGMNFGDETFSLVDELFKLPKEVLEDDKLLQFTYRLNGRTTTVELDTSKLFDKKLKETTERTIQTVQAKLANIVADDTTIGVPVSEALVDILREGNKVGAAATAVKEKAAQILLGMEKINALDPSGTETALQDVFYLSSKAKITGKTPAASLFSPTRQAADDVGYTVVGNINDAKTALIGPEYNTAAQAFDAGIDIAIVKDGAVKINPKSTIFRKFNKTENEKVRTFFNTRAKQTADSVVPTIADLQTPSAPLSVVGNSVSAGTRSFNFKPTSFAPPQDSVEATARHLWASSLNKKLDDVVIDSFDFSTLDALLQNKELIGENIRFRMPDGSLKPLTEIVDLTSWVVNKKLEYIIKELDTAGVAKMAVAEAQRTGKTVDPALATKAAKEVDLRDLAYRVNSEADWVINAVATEFNNTKLLSPEAIRPLTSYAKRENVEVIYNRAIFDKLMQGDFPDAMVAYETRKTVAIQKAQEAAAAVLKGDYDKFIDLVPEAVTKKFESAGGVGATGFGFSNADYGDLPRLWAQDVGKTVSLVSQRRVNDALTTLQGTAAKIQLDPKAGAELAAVLTRIRRSEDPLTMMRLGVDDSWHLVDLASKKDYEKILQTIDRDAAEAGKFKVKIPLSAPVADFLGTHHQLHTRQLGDRIQLANAQGTTLHWNAEALYVPPIDTRKVPYFAFVRQKEGAAFGASEVAMITARSPEELQQLVAKVPDNYDVIFKADTELYHRALGDYQYSRALNQPTLDPFLRKQGRLGDFLPSLDGKAAIEDFVVYHTRKEQQIVRDAVEVKYGQIFAELRWLSEQSTKIEKSKFSFLGKQAVRTIADPFQDYIKTALNISKRAEYTLWHNANEFIDSLGTRAYRAVEQAQVDAKNGKITWEEGNALMEKMGLGSPFSSQEAFLTAQVGNDRNLIRQAIAKGNMLLATVGLRLDWANSLLNIISTPILLSTEMASLKSAIRGNSEIAGKLREMTHVIDPATKMEVPTTRKLLMRAIANYWTPAGKANIVGRYKDIGAIKDVLSMHHAMMEDIALTPDFVPRKWADKVGQWTEKAASFTGNNFSEQFTRFVSADVMRQMTDPLVAAGRMSAKEQNAYISIFVNRVQGNYIASQRPVAFQGSIGSAIGLFQTYQFNLFQQLFRHIENRDLRAVAVMGGMQTSLFGLNGLPLFEAINTQLIGQANINQQHHDAYSFAVQAAGKEMGDWLMYGSASAFPLFSDKMPALYSRGDLNPRHVSIIPTTPMQVPIVEAGSRVVGNLATMAKMLGGGAEVLPTLLFGMEHNGISRPLAGVAQSLQGFSTTSKGSLIGQASDYSAIATSSRVLGARPMDEAVALSAKFRLEGYKAADRARIEELGAVVKSKIRNGTLTADDINDLQARYAELGGRVETFAAALQRWQKGATQSVVNVIADSQKTAYGRRMNEIMGADRLEDARYPETAEQ